MYFSSSKDTYYDLETEFIDFLFETPELSEVMRRIVLKGKIPYEKLKEMFVIYSVRNSNNKADGTITFPNFYNDEVERKTNILKTALAFVEDDLIRSKSEQKTWGEEDSQRVAHAQYNSENMTALRKLYLDVIQEIDLLDTEIYSKKEEPIKGFLFNPDNGVLKFSGKDITLAKRKQISDAVLLMRSLVNAENNEWLEKGEILADWGLTKEDRDIATRNKLFNAGKVVNQFIKDETGIDDFVECTTRKARINPKYR